MFKLRYSIQDVHDACKNATHKVFGTFICAGGSSMGYKLAGFNHIGGVEIDPRCADLYKTNLNPKFLFLEDIRAFNERTDIPDELYSLDILDGSPPCSLFSMAGDREKAWGKEKKFREGQSSQTLDDLVFVYIETINKLRPKVAILENVPGIIIGSGKAYSKQIISKLNAHGYDVQVFDLNGGTMGLPQARRRIFFVCRRRDCNFRPLTIKFDIPGVKFGEVKSPKGLERDSEWLLLFKKHKYITDKCMSEVFKRIGIKNRGFTTKIVWDHSVCPTITSSAPHIRGNDNSYLSDHDHLICGTFPLDYDFKGSPVQYYIGMSVPPLMMANLACEIKRQWFD